MKILDEPSPAPACLLLQMGPMSANKSSLPREEGLIEHHRRCHQRLNVTFSIPLAKGGNVEYFKEIQCSLKRLYRQARQPAVKSPCAE